MLDILSVAQMKKSDEYTIKNKVSEKELIYRAGKGIYQSVKWFGKIAIVCGSGNNGCDGLALSLILKENGYNPEVITVSEKRSDSKEYYLSLCRQNGILISDYSEKTDFSKYDIIVDCIFGTGFLGKVRDFERTVIEKINESNSYIVSADINSGLNGDSGMADVCVKSDLTVSIGYYKPGHFLSMAKDAIKEKTNQNIGIEATEKNIGLIEKDDVMQILGVRKNFSNKGTYGYIALIGGSTEYSGAIKLANLSLSAVKAGAGVVKLAVPKSICAGVLPYVLESTLYPLSDREGSIEFNERETDSLLKNTTVCAIGMGLGQKGDNEKVISYILGKYDKTLIIDADGLNTLSKMSKETLKNSRCTVILTPHLLEFSRLTGIDKKEILNNPIFYAKQYASETNTVVLLKGPTTVITDGEEVILSDTGCAGMAKGGSGDVLTGIIAGICSYGSGGKEGRKRALYNTAGAAYINGLAGQMAEKRANQISMVPSDTINSVSEAIGYIIK